MSHYINLLEGNIFKSLTRLALPIMATSLIQMAYNLTDMIWIGNLGANAVAAVGAAGMFMWLSESLMMLARMGGQVMVAQSLGAGERDEAARYAKNAFQIGLSLAVLYAVLVAVFHKQLIGFFRLSGAETIAQAETYLRIICLGILFSFTIQLFTGMITATGNSRTPFRATSLGLVINIILDPLLIFVAGWGVAGAAIATVFAQAVVAAVYLRYARRDELLFSHVRLFEKPDPACCKRIVKIGLPSAFQTLIFSSMSMFLARLVATFGDAAIAVQKVGSQIESISWMTADGFAAAVNSFVAQNYGNKNIPRAKQGYYTGLRIMLCWGAATTLLLILGAAPLFRIFIREADVLPLGVDYLRILGVSQMLMCVEIVTAGAFAGFGRTLPSALVSTTLTAARVPMAMLLTTTALGLNGVWVSVTLSSMLKGIVLFSLFCVFIRRLQRREGAGRTE